ncbi:MAG: hypothetical protein KDK30_04820 [Leptospiraceae bacterium]|nr:hypothetical protein [Leptospiraceae bacterium]MCB1314848.1 hypothetical protein [Leptospiraceae bacterium]MCB1321638.1 hypothetical protein [Leptospiraceae bacterium]
MRSERRVHIISAGGAELGSGHLVRMRELQRRLDEQHVRVEIIAPDNVSHNAFDTDLFILDARDIDPRPFARRAPVLALDNRHAERPGLETYTAARFKKNTSGSDEFQYSIQNIQAQASSYPECKFPIVFVDTIPHPQADLADTLRNALLFELDSAETNLQQRRTDRLSLFVYAGDWKNKAVHSFFTRLIDENVHYDWHICGRFVDTWQAGPQVRLSTHLERPAFVQALRSADLIWTYFGITMLEAWYLRKPVVLFAPGDSEHAVLGDYLQQAARIPFISIGTDIDTALAKALRQLQSQSRSLPAQIPDGRGFQRLLDQIHLLLKPHNA